MVDTVRTIDELLNVLFASDQAAHSISEQDIRDAIVSISLETADLSGLPRSMAGLNPGRLWIDSTEALRCNLTYVPSLVIDTAGVQAGAGHLFADAGVPFQANVVEAYATFAGAGGSSFDVSRFFEAAAQTAGGVGAISAMPGRGQRVASTIRGAGGLTAAPVVRRGAQVGSGRFNAAGALTANAAVPSGQAWGTVASSISLSNGNLTATRTGLYDGAISGARASRYYTTGKYYWEVVMAGGASLSTVSFGNPSTFIGNEVDPSSSNDCISYYTYQGVGGLYILNLGWVQEMPAFDLTSNVGFALDMSHGWWVRVNGGTWTGAGPNSGDPATGSNPITAWPTTTGGLGPVGMFSVYGQSQTLKIAAGSWSYTAPGGFGAM